MASVRRALPRLAAAGATLLLLGACESHLPRTPLFQGVEALDASAGEQLIRQRLAQAFPVGGPEAGLEPYLRAQGLSTHRRADAGSGAPPIQGEASARGPGSPCPRMALVTWRADAAGVLRSLSVFYRQAACP